MSVALITGSSGLIGSETARWFHEKGLTIVGVDNNMREYFFGADGSVDWNTKALQTELKNFTHLNQDIRSESDMESLFKKYGKDISVIIHTAAQPSHDWAAREPFTDFSVNATGTLVLLEMTRRYCPDAVFIFTSTNKVYGDAPNFLPLIEQEKRWELDPSHVYAEHGIDETMSIDQCKHSIFGASKVAADVMCQEYGKYFGMKTGLFRGGCLTGPAHSGAELHGFLAYFVKCALSGKHYNVFGYKGKQVRDNIHSWDLVNAFWQFFENPRSGVAYNMGGSRHSNCSILEAVDLVRELSGKELPYTIKDDNRIGDHIWYVSDVRRFQQDYPDWKYKYGLNEIFKEIIDAVEDRGV